MKDYIKKYLQEKDLNFKEAGSGQFILEICPACGDNAFHHFYMNQEEGLWDCKKCAAKGNFNQFRKFYGDSDIDLSEFGKGIGEVKIKEYRTLKYDIPLQYAARLWSMDKHLADYLLNIRKLTKETLEHFKIGSTGKEISIPIYEDDKLVNIRYRRDPALDGDDKAGSRYSQEKGCKAALFNGDILKEPLKQVFVTEGEFDAMQLVQRGFRNTVSVTLGSGYFPQNWVDKFQDIQQIYLCYDTDEEGLSGAKKAAEKLGIEKCKLVLLPKKEGRKKTDITNYFNDDGFTKTDFLELVKKARSVGSDGDSIKHISEFNELMRKVLTEGEHLGHKTGYTKLDDMMGGLRKGRLVIVSGLTNTGKSSFAINVGLNMAEAKLPIFYFSLEMPPIDIAKKFLMLKAKLTNQDMKEVKDPSDVLTRIDKTFLEFRGEKEGEAMPIYLFNGSGVLKYKTLADCARIAKEEYGMQAIFVDHLHYFVQNYNNITSETSKIVREIKQLAIELDIPIILLAHLNRGGRTKQRKGMYIPSLSDLKDSGTIEQDADQVLFVCRDSESDEKEEREQAVLKVAKNRDGYAGRSVSMTFSEDLTTFLEVIDGVDYELEAKEKKAEADMTLESKPEIDVSSLPF